MISAFCYFGIITQFKPNKMNQSIVVVGSSNIDLIAKLSHLPKPGETVGDGEYSQAHGGKGANQAVAAARDGAEVSFISSLGDDDFGHQMISSFKQYGINTDYVKQTSGVATGTAFIWVDAKGENSIAVAPGANNLLTPDYVDECRMVISGADLVLLQLENPMDTVAYVIDLCASLGKKVILNAAPAKKIDRKYIKPLHSLIVNETEAAIISGIEISNQAHVEEAAKAMLGMGTESVIITLGAKGAFYMTKRGSKYVDTYTVQPIDTTGAGDVFCGVISSQIIKNKKLENAVKYANAAAALSTTTAGAQPSIPMQADTKAFINQNEF